MVVIFITNAFFNRTIRIIHKTKSNSPNFKSPKKIMLNIPIETDGKIYKLLIYFGK